MLVVLLALPALRADDKPKEEKKPPTPREQYQELLKEFSAKQREIIAEIQKAKGEEQQKLMPKYYGLGKEFAEKFYKLGEDNPKDAVANDAYFWIVQNAADSSVYGKAMEKVKAAVADMPLADLSRRLGMVRGGNIGFMEAVFSRAEKEEKEPAAGDLLAWLATNASQTPIGSKATERLLDKYPGNPGIERLCTMLGQGYMPKAGETLKLILDKSTKSRVKGAAALGLAKIGATETDKLGDKPEELEKAAAEAESYFAKAIELYGTENSAQQKDVERELKAFRTFRVGKEVPEISGTDLDEKAFKLSDYRGKVVLLDFWGFW
jgi:hypothetical protein